MRLVKNIRYKVGETVKYRLNQNNVIKEGEVIEAHYNDDFSWNSLGDMYLISDGERRGKNEVPCYVVNEKDILG